MSHAKALSRQVQHYRSNSDATDVFNLLTSPDLLDVVEDQLQPGRERLFPPTETLAMFTAQLLSQDRSCQNAVNQSAVQRRLYGLPRCSVSTGGYCQARQRLPLNAISHLARFVGGQLSSANQPGWQWLGHSVRLVDGTTLTLSDTPANQAEYPQSGSQYAGLGFPVCRLLGVFDLGSGALLNAAASPYQGKGTGESTLLRSLLPTLATGEILLGDAIFSSWPLINALNQRGVHGVFERHGSRSAQKGIEQSLGSKDRLVRLPKPSKRPVWMTKSEYDSAPPEITVREVEVSGKVLVTTLLDPACYPKSAIKALYKQRWDVELNFRHIKTTLGMEHIPCRTPDMALKAIWAYLLAYNLIRQLMAQSALASDVLPRQLSFKHSVQLWLIWNNTTAELKSAERGEELLLMVSALLVGERPGRVEPRVRKRRPKPYPLMMDTRGYLQQQVRLNGHPSRKELKGKK